MASRTMEVTTINTRKRAAQDDLERDQRFAKRFDLLSLDHNGKLYIPISSSNNYAPISPQNPSPTKTENEKRNRPQRVPSEDDCMQVDESKHKVYIYDLEQDLADVESDDEHPIFLSDIEKHLNKIPRHILMHRDPDANENNQLILYTDPTSLTIPKEQDSVRKAIIEARSRLRQGQLVGANVAIDATNDPQPMETLSNSVKPDGIDEDDLDAMDMD